MLYSAYLTLQNRSLRIREDKWLIQGDTANRLAQAKSEPWSLLPPPYSGSPSEKTFLKKKSHDSVVFFFLLGLVSKPSRIPQCSGSQSKESHLSPPRAGLWSCPAIHTRQAGAASWGGSSLLEQGKSMKCSQRQDGGWLWNRPQMGRQVPTRPQNSLSPRRGPVDSPGHLQTAY